MIVPHRSRSAVLGGGLVLVLAAALLLGVSLLRQRDVPQPSAAAPRRTLRWQPGTEQSYRLEVDSRVHVLAGGSGGAEPMTYDVRGILSVTTLAVDEGGATVAMQLYPVALIVSGVVDNDASLALSSEFRVRFTAAGMPREFSFPPAVRPEHQQQLEQLVRTFQLVLRGEAEWDAEESHGTGTYVAHYEREGGDCIRRRKLRYLDPAATQPLPPTPHGRAVPWRPVQVRRGEATAHLAAVGDWLDGMVVNEMLATTTDAGLHLEVETDATLERLSAEQLPAALLRAASGSPAGGDAAIAAAAARRASPMTEQSSAELAIHLRELVHALDQADDGRADWIHRLRDLMRSDQRLADLLLALLQELPWRDRTRADLFLAFELGGTAEAQAALCRVATEPGWQHRDRTRALIALGGLAHPTEQSLATLWAVGRDRSTLDGMRQANAATLALGVLAGRMDHADGADYPNLRDGLLSAAWGAGDASERSICITALGNTGDPALAAEIVPFLDDAAAGVRRAAARTLGKFGGDRAAIELGLRLRQEPNSAVRAAMAGALASGPTIAPEVMAFVHAAITTEQDDRARLELARVLGRDLATHPENAAVLRQLLVTERSQRVRRHVGEMLAAFDAGGVDLQREAGDARSR